MQGKQKLIPSNEVPPGHFHFTCPETGYAIETLSKEELFHKIENHYRENDIPLKEGWQDEVEDRICQGLPPGWCSFVEEKDQLKMGSPHSLCQITKKDLINGIFSLTNLLLKFIGRKEIYVSEEEAEKRAEICAKCNFNVSVNACMGCHGMQTLLTQVAKVKGSRKTKWDHILKNCCKCKCRNEAIVHIRKDILLTGQSEKDVLEYPVWCWKRAKTLEQAKQKLSISSFK